MALTHLAFPSSLDSCKGARLRTDTVSTDARPGPRPVTDSTSASLSLSPFLSLSLSLSTPPFARSHARALSVSLARVLSLSLSRSLFLYISRSLPPSLFLTDTLSGARSSGRRWRWFVYGLDEERRRAPKWTCSRRSILVKGYLAHKKQQLPDTLQ